MYIIKLEFIHIHGTIILRILQLCLLGYNG